MGATQRIGTLHRAAPRPPVSPDISGRSSLTLAAPPQRDNAGQHTGLEGAYFSPSWTAFQADRGRDFSVIVDGVSV
jgi:hypothetical protein